MSKELTRGNNSPMTINLFDNSQFETMLKVATFFSNSELVPEMYRVSEKITPEKAQANCMIALSLAQRMGADALMVMQNLIVISGRPSWSAKFLIATVNTSGRFDTLKYRMTNKGKIGKMQTPVIIMKPIPGQNGRQKVTEWVEKDYSNVDDLYMVAYSKESGTDEELVSTEVSIRMAILEGWYEKNGSKWPTMPEKMLKYRAASFWTNEYAPEISMGMKTDDEEMDIIDTDYEEVSTKITAPVKEKENFDFDNAAAVKKEPETVKTEVPKDETKKVDPEADKVAAKAEAPKDEPKKDVLAEQGRAIAEKEAETAKIEKNNPDDANAGVAPSFGKGLFSGDQN